SESDDPTTNDQRPTTDNQRPTTDDRRLLEHLPDAEANRGGIAQPVRWGQPYEGEDGDDPQVVGKRRAFVGPEEGAPEEPRDRGRPARDRLLVEYHVG